MIQIGQLIREGRDAVIAERFGAGCTAANPYRAASKRHLFWQRGADQARVAIDAVMKIGA